MKTTKETRAELRRLHGRYYHRSSWADATAAVNALPDLLDDLDYLERDWESYIKLLNASAAALRERGRWQRAAHAAERARREVEQERDQLAEKLRVAVDVATGRIEHLWDGSCPDGIEGHDRRGAFCPACQALARIEGGGDE